MLVLVSLHTLRATAVAPGALLSRIPDVREAGNSAGGLGKFGLWQNIRHYRFLRFFRENLENLADM